jgi:hypothetical protein
LGRVCLDLDGDGRCSAGEPGVAGARIAGEGGEVALADAEGRFHLLEVPSREMERDRTGRGGHALRVEGLGRSRAYELSPSGAAQVDVAVPVPARTSPPRLAPATGPGGALVRGADGRLRWDLAGRTAPGARVAVGDERAVAGDDGVFTAPVLLAPGETRLGVVVLGPEGAGAVYAWKVQLVRRRRGGDLVAPERPELLGSFDAAPSPAGALVVGRAGPGLRVRVGGVLVQPAQDGLFAAAAPAREPSLEVLDGAGRLLASSALPLAPASGIRSAVALGELEVSFLGHPGVLVTGRGAGAARARVGAVEVEAGVDLDERDRKAGLADLVRPRDGLAAEHALAPERTLATAGDGGAADDRNPGRGRLWARAEGEGMRLDLGAVRSGLTGSELGRYDRELFGAKARGEGALGPLRLEGSAFGATLRDDARGNAPPAPAHDVLAAGGGAALWLAHGAVVPGSEALRVEWRDPFTGRLVRQAVLVRGRDYEIDWTSGRVVLAAPLASVGGRPSLSTADPFQAPQASIVADYLYAVAGPAAEDLQGGRVGAALGPLSLGANAGHEQRLDGSWRLVAGQAALDLGPLLRVRAEAARSEGALFGRGAPLGFSRSQDGGYTFDAPAAPAGAADAIHAEASGGAGPVRAAAWWRAREAGYSDSEFREARGARERGAEVSAGAAALSGSLLWAERRGGDPADPLGLALLSESRLVARAGWQGERLGLAAEGVRAVREGTRPGEESSAGLRASWRVDPALAVDLSHHQGLRVTGEGRDPTFTAAGAEIARGPAELAVRGGWGPELGPRLLVSGERAVAGEAVYGTFTADPDAPSVLGGRTSASALGARSRARGTEVFTEEQLARDPFGLRTSRVVGAALEPRPGLRVSLSGERGERLRLDGSRVDRRAAAASGGLALGPVRLGIRGEVRAEGSDAQAGAGGSAEWGPVRGAALSARVSWLHGTFAGREALGFAATLAGALRSDRGSLLASVSRLADMRPGELRRDGVVSRLAATASAGRLEAGLGGGLALQRVAGGSDDRVSASARIRVRVAGPFDGAAEYARRAPLGGGRLGALDAARAEVGVSKGETRLAVGYTFIGFGGDGLTPAEDTSRLYVRAQLAY